MSTFNVLASWCIPEITPAIQTMVDESNGTYWLDDFNGDLFVCFETPFGTYPTIPDGVIVALPHVVEVNNEPIVGGRRPDRFPPRPQKPAEA